MISVAAPIYSLAARLFGEANSYTIPTVIILL